MRPAIEVPAPMTAADGFVNMGVKTRFSGGSSASERRRPAGAGGFAGAPGRKESRAAAPPIPDEGWFRSDDVFEQAVPAVRGPCPGGGKFPDNGGARHPGGTGHRGDPGRDCRGRRRLEQLSDLGWPLQKVPAASDWPVVGVGRIPARPDGGRASALGAVLGRHPLVTSKAASHNEQSRFR